MDLKAVSRTFTPHGFQKSNNCILPYPVLGDDLDGATRSVAYCGALGA